MKENREKNVIGCLAEDIRQLFEKKRFDLSFVQEIRLRCNRPLIVLYMGKEYFIDCGGELMHRNENAFVVSENQIRESLEYLSNYSLYAFEEQLKRGYITIEGGHRVGVAGKMIIEGNDNKMSYDISFLNIRFAHEVINCCKKIFPFLLDKGYIKNTLIVSPPGCGKTTLLRDMVREISDGNELIKGQNVGVVDERSEIAACYRGIPQNNVGKRTDVLDGCPKKAGMMMLVRSMAPKVIAVDEIGSGEDMDAIKYVMNCGVKVIATIHGNSMEDIKNVVSKKIFDRYIVLTAGKVGEISNIFNESGEKICCDF